MPAIAIGHGLGTAQTLPTVVANLEILTVMELLDWTKRENEDKNLYLSVHAPGSGESDLEVYPKILNEAVSKNAVGSDVRRFDLQDGLVEATYRNEVTGPEAVSALTEICTDVGVTLLDQNRMR